MKAQLDISYLRLVRNVLGYQGEQIEATPGLTIRDLLQILIEKHGEPFRASVFRSEGELRSPTLVWVNDRDIDELEGSETRLESGGKISVVVGVYPPERGDKFGNESLVIGYFSAQKGDREVVRFL